MTQRIFKKSCKQDMIDLFSILPYWVEKIEVYGYDIIAQGKIEYYTSRLSISNVFKIDFETGKSEEMIIERPKETK